MIKNETGCFLETWCNFCFGLRESNEEAVRLVREMKLEDSEVLPMIRMYRNGEPQAISGRVFAVTSVEICGF